MKDRVFLSIGSNSGDRAANCKKALALLSGSPSVEVVAVSPFYETEPWGVREQARFVNAAVEIRTPLAPHELLALLRSIEAAVGREKTFRWGPRVIDLDIVFYGARVVDEHGLEIPHPRAQERAFVLVPLNDIAPDFTHPVLGKTVSELLGSLGGARAAKRLPEA